MRKLFMGFMGILLMATALCQAAPLEPLPMDQAFVFSATANDAETLVARFKIRPGYYLYKNHMRFSIENAHLGTLHPPILPVGLKKHVEDLGVFEVYTDVVNIGIPFKPRPNTQSVELIVHFQGCSDAGYCYPPIAKKVHLSLKKGFGHFVSGSTIDAPMFEDDDAPGTSQDQITSLLSSKSLWTILLSFFGFGLLLAFTPCVLPMVPILSSIIVGQKGKIQTKRAFWLSLTYVVAMSLAYAVAGVLVGYAGGSIQAMLQTPLVIGLSSALFIALALSLFGFYELRLPNSWQNKLTAMSNQQTGGSYLGVAVMGFLAALIVSPCVTPALVGALGYIAKSGNALLGGAALFTLGLGMGTPLLAIGTASGKLLPKAGTWMKAISHLFGVIMLGMAIWMLERILPGQITLGLWAALAIVCSVFLGGFRRDIRNSRQRLTKGFATILLVYGSLMLIGAGMGNTDPLHPLNGLQIGRASSTQVPKDYFQVIKNVDDVKKQVNKSEKIVLLDFYADWCVACKIMEKNVLSQPKVRSLLDHFTVLKANVTHNDPSDKALQKFYSIVAPPTYLFLTPDGEELKNERIVGEMDLSEFSEHLQRMLDMS